MGGAAVGGVPYNDTDGCTHLRLVFDLAREFDHDVDLHLDFSDGPGDLLVGEVADLAIARGWQGRVCAGHGSALGALEPSALAPLAARIRDAGVSILVLPATDLYLMGRNDARNVRRGLAPVRRTTCRTPSRHSAMPISCESPTCSRMPRTSGRPTISGACSGWRRRTARARSGAPTMA